MFYKSLKRPIMLRQTSLMLALAYGLAGCNTFVQDVDLDRLPKSDPKLVVHSYLSPQDTLLVAAVSMSRTVAGVQSSTNRYNSIANASVTLSDGNRSVAMIYDAKLAIYSADPQQFPIVAGHTYRLVVRTPDGLSAEASTTVPAAVPISSVQVDSATARFERGMDYYVQLSWQDPAGVKNYYHVAGDNEFGATSREYQGPNSYTDVPFRYVGSINFGSPAYVPIYLLTDEAQNGQLITSPKGHLGGYSRNGERVMIPPLMVNVYLHNVTEAYYQYHNSLQVQQDASNNPFAEPTLVTGNIQGGFGCFGAFNRSAISMRLK